MVELFFRALQLALAIVVIGTDGYGKKNKGILRHRCIVDTDFMA